MVKANYELEIFYSRNFLLFLNVSYISKSIILKSLYIHLIWNKNISVNLSSPSPLLISKDIWIECRFFNYKIFKSQKPTEPHF